MTFIQKLHWHSQKENGLYNMTASLTARKMKNYKIIMISTNVGQNTAEFSDKHILLTMLCILCSDLWLKPHYALYPNEKVFLQINAWSIAY